MNLESALRAQLLADATVSGLIGTRLYPVVLPEGVQLPAVTYQRVSRTPARDLGGVAYTQSRIQVDCWGRSYGDAKAVAHAVRAAAGRPGAQGDVRIMLGTTAGEMDSYEPDTQLYRVSVDLLMVHEGGEDQDG